jgi:membrane protein DedA with SNARE-associated domain
MDNFTQLLNHYGYIFIFISLYLELMALPLPGELLMSYCGFLVFQGKLDYTMCILSASGGAICGMTTSYLIGKHLGVQFITKYGKYIGLGPDHFEKVSNWFIKSGNKLLVFTCFILGVRHVTGYVSGTTNISYKKFALHSYFGAFLWTTTFISIGKALGNKYKSLHIYAFKYLIIGLIAIIFVVTIVYLYRKYKVNINKSIYDKINSLFVIYGSLGKFKLIIPIIVIGYAYLTVKAFELINSFFAHRLLLFDKVTTIITKALFSKYVIKNIDIFKFLSFKYITIFIVLNLVGWVLFKDKNKYKDIIFILITVFGGTIIVELINKTFEFNNLNIKIGEFVKYSFPSEDIFFISTLFGTVLYFLIKYSKGLLTKNIAIFIVILGCLAMGVRDIVLNIQNPTGIIAGYLFATLWVVLNIIILELSIVLPKIKVQNQNKFKIIKH